ncbi:MAG: DUF3048 domain-containing protein [Candidatus Dormibacteraceae bacterium]
MSHLPLRPSRRQTMAGAAVVAVAAVLAAVLITRAMLSPAIHARLEGGDLGRVRPTQSLVIQFDQPMDLAGARVAVTPATATSLSGSGRRLTVTPSSHWRPGQRYTLRLAPTRDASHSATLSGWRGNFTTLPEVAVAGLEVDGKPVTSARREMTPASGLSLVFTAPMRTGSVSVTVNTLAVTALAWSPDRTTVTFADSRVVPGQVAAIQIGKGAISAKGDPLADPGHLRLEVVGLEPANSTTGVTPGFKTKIPMEVVVENSGPARPQSGLQNADMVYEYISEYSITRMTAIYFNDIPPLIGPVRSCRMINPYLDYAYDGLFMCSGASVGTLHYMFGDRQSLPVVPGVINDFDTGNHFFRSGINFAPHNLFTDRARVLRFRREWAGAPHARTFSVDPPHPDVVAGDPAPPPGVPLHGVSYQYDAAGRQYLRSDHGTPFIDAATGRQLRVKNVVLLHVPFHYTDWIEDENGGAHSVWYSMLGSGPADIYSDGRVVHATWHMGSSPSEWYYDNHTPVYFTDAQGGVIRLNTGLTWIHVLGDGQSH